MDAVSYANSAKQAQRIKKFIENPDSTSGIVTVPKTIASGETITIPSGRVAILPNVQIDGVLNVENGGEVFIPSGATLSRVVEKVTSTDNAIVRFDGTTGKVQDSSILIDDNGNLNITGTGKKITGDFSNATPSNQVMFQTNLANNATNVSLIPNGTFQVANMRVFNSSDPNNASFGQIRAGSSEISFHSTAFGTGTFLPITFNTGGAERMRIDTAGNVLVTGGGGLGYGAGSGGTVTQLTSKSTGVTLNKPTGKITMNNATLAAGAKVEFILSSTILNINSIIILTINDGIAEPRNYSVEQVNSVSGAAYIRITNLSGGSLSEAVGIQFNIIKGANS